MFQSALVKNIILPFFSGILIVMGFPSSYLPQIFFAPIIGMALFFFSIGVFEKKIYPNKIFIIKYLISYFFLCIGYTFSGFYWISFTLSEFANISYPLNYLALIPFAITTLPHIFAIVIILILKKWRNKPSKWPHNDTTLKILFFSFFVTMLEYFLPNQFPAPLGSIWIVFTPYLGLAPIIGQVGFSFLSFTFAAILANYLTQKVFDRFAFILIATILMCNFIIPGQIAEDTKKHLNIRIVQANIDNHLKIESEQGHKTAEEEIYNRYKNLTLQEKESFKPELIIWPETAVPVLHYFSNNRPFSLPTIIKEIVNQTNADIIYGGYEQKVDDVSLTDFQRSFETQYNSAFFVGKDESKIDINLKDRYHKIKLLSFGETLPFGSLNKHIAPFIPAVSFFATGERLNSFTIKNDINFVTNICYEILFPMHINKHLNNLYTKPNFMINLTNDAWYGDTSEPLQHLFLARWRAVELNMPILRSTNTGITAIINGDGTIKEITKINEAINLDLSLKIKTSKVTPYQAFGSLWTITLFVILIVIVQIRRFL